MILELVIVVEVGLVINLLDVPSVHKCLDSLPVVLTCEMKDLGFKYGKKEMQMLAPKVTNWQTLNGCSEESRCDTG